jgi:hypothetical protein
MSVPHPRPSKVALGPTPAARLYRNGSVLRAAGIRGTTIAGLLACATVQLTASQAVADSPTPPIPESQATLKPIGFGISRITLLPRAAKRLDIQTGTMSEDNAGRKIVPYSSIIYDLDGDAWVYTVMAPLTYVRELVVIEQITQDYAYLSDGPTPGTRVVTVGVPELYGTEVGVNGE